MLLDISDDDLEKYRDAKYPMRHVRDIASYLPTVMGHMFLGGQDKGDPLPWEKAHQIRFRPGEVTLWHGINGHGKSALTTQVAAWLAIRDRRSCIASFEMLPERTIERMIKQVCGGANPHATYLDEFFPAFKSRIFIYDRRDRVDRALLLRVIRYCAVEKGVSHFWVDSLMKCVAGEDDYNGQKDFVGDLCALARETGLHIHLVHHVRKTGDESQVPNKFDAKGSGAITDQVDNVLAVWRNKAKEASRQLGEAVDEGKPDFLLCCDKQRNGGWEGKIGLYGDVSCWHFREHQTQGFSRGYKLPEPAREPGQDEQEAA
ncbi:MAG: hypothetical protein QG586_1944 [Pseudomonadota bacterium]|nr:hypothetical protein [Pseudomonadota bacterium]